jgi:hypothetical protein
MTNNVIRSSKFGMKDQPPTKGQTIEVRGTIPDVMPKIGETVIVTMPIDQQLIGSGVVATPVVVMTVDQATGAVAGWAYSMPGMMIPGPGGKPMQAPPVLWMPGAPYSRQPSLFTWMYPEEIDAMLKQQRDASLAAKQGDGSGKDGQEQEST